MRVTITVEGVTREFDVRPDLIGPNMGEWQDATEMSLLRAFGAAYREAVRLPVPTVAQAHAEPSHTEAAVEPVPAEPDLAEPAAVEAAVAAVATAEPAPVAELSHPNTKDDEQDAAVVDEQAETPETVTVVEAFYVPDAAPVQVHDTPFADAAPVEEFGQVQAYVASEDDVEAFLSEIPSVATEAPAVTICRCGHAVGWHASEVHDVTGPCLMVWPIDEHDPQGAASKCACLTFEPADVRFPER